MSRLRNNGYVWNPTPEKKILSWDGEQPGARYSGWFKLILRNADGSIARETDWIHNILCHNFFISKVDYVTADSTSKYIAIGTGTGTAAATDTALWGSQLGDRESGGGSGAGSFVVDGQYARWRYAARWEAGEGTGTISELGAFNSTSGGEMHSHALLVDSGGSPTTIVKGASQILDVIWEIRHYPDTTAAVTGTIDISGVSYDYSIQPVGLREYTGTNWSAIVGRSVFGSSFAGYFAFTGQNYPGLTATPPYDGSQVNPTGFAVTPFGGAPYAWSDGGGTGPFYTNNQFVCGIDAWHGTIGSINIEAGGSYWQVILDKTVGGGGLVKTDEQQLALNFRLTIGSH